MNSIELTTRDTYKKNTLYLKESHPHLYNKIQKLDQDLANGKKKETFVLEYIHEQYFDALNLETNTYIYGMNSLEYSKSLLNVVDLKKTGNLFEAEREIEYIPEILNYFDSLELSQTNPTWASIRPIYYNFQYAHKSNSSMLRAYKVLFLDLRLGLHLEGIIQKLKPKHTFVLEKNLETFRLSLFVTPYYEIKNNVTIYFSIEENNEGVNNIFFDFLQNDNQYNLYMKHITLTNDYFKSLQKLQGDVFTQSYLQYPFVYFFMQTLSAPKYLVEEYFYVDVSKRYSNTIFGNKPVLLLFSGPSSQKYLEWVKKAKNKFTIISPISALKHLSMNDIKPDILVHIDSKDKASVTHIKNVDKEFYKDSIFIFGSTVHPNFINCFEKEKIFLVPISNGHKHQFGHLTSPSVGEFTYALLLGLGIENIYLLGLDMALDAETLQTHTIDLEGGHLKGKDTTDIVTEKITYVKGNKTELVPTVNKYITSIDHFEKYSLAFKKVSQHAYNLSDGAFLGGSIPLSVDEIKLREFPDINKNINTQNIYDFMTLISSNEFRNVDKELIQYHISRGKKSLKIIDKHARKKYKSSDNYLKALLDLSSELGSLEINYNALAHAYYYYFQSTIAYPFDLFNTENLTNIEKHINDFDTIFTKELKRIANTFIKRMEEYL